jgi:CNT family concentrative nucleoside transporter
MAILAQAQGLIGLALILLIAWGLSENRRVRPSWRWIGGAVALQIAIAATLTLVPGVWQVLSLANHAVSAIETATLAGSSYMFGFIGGGEAPFVLKPGAAAPVVLAFQILPLIIVYSALAALAWHLGVLGVLVRGLSWALQRTLGVSGVVGEHLPGRG